MSHLTFLLLGKVPHAQPALQHTGGGPEWYYLFLSAASPRTKACGGQDVTRSERNVIQIFKTRDARKQNKSKKAKQFGDTSPGYFSAVHPTTLPTASIEGRTRENALTESQYLSSAISFLAFVLLFTSGGGRRYANNIPLSFSGGALIN